MSQGAGCSHIGNDIPTRRYKGDSAMKVSFSSENTENAELRASPIGGIFNILINSKNANIPKTTALAKYNKVHS